MFGYMVFQMLNSLSLCSFYWRFTSMSRRISYGVRTYSVRHTRVCRTVYARTANAVRRHRNEIDMLSAPQEVRVWLLTLAYFAMLLPMFIRILLQIPSGAYRHQTGNLRCGNGHDALYGLCQRYGVQSLYQQHYHPITIQHGFFQLIDLSADERG